MAVTWIKENSEDRFKKLSSKPDSYFDFYDYMSCCAFTPYGELVVYCPKCMFVNNTIGRMRYIECRCGVVLVRTEEDILEVRDYGDGCGSYV